MPRKTKDEEVKKVTKTSSKKANTVEVEKKSTSIKKATKTATSKKTTTTKKKSATTKEITLKTPEKKATTKSSTTKKATVAKTTKKTTARKSSTQTTRKRTTKRAKPVITTEYYDLPAVYNRTIVKILAQTPSSLFVYWEISEEDKKKLQLQYGEAFFQNTKPYLVITNETMNYSFETEINDYANSWYIHIHDSSCKYGVQLIRKSIHHNTDNSHSVINIISSNEIATPNDHILFDKLGKTVFFRDVKSNREVEKDISSLSFISNIGRVYNIYDLYKEIYKNELNGDELGMGLSSSGFSSNFR
ncbi:MAG: DUF4912 domain-containing protein [Clostridia bacterium]|nr:DUF4912 domain-containing protein [Clostridia bacterium]